MELVVRAGLAAAFLVGVVATVAIARWRYRRRVASHAGQSAADLAARFGLPAGVPSVLFLSTPRCVECVELQEPALARLQSGHRVEVRKLWVSDVPDIAARFSILTAPSTIVLGADHRVQAINVGFADTPTLAGQLG